MVCISDLPLKYGMESCQLWLNVVEFGGKER